MTLTPFDETLTAERTPVFTLSSIHPLSPLRNVVTGSPTEDAEEYRLAAGDKIESADIGNYVPGYAAEAGIGVRVSVLPTGSQVMRWGLYDTEDGFFYELTTAGLFAVVRRNSEDTRVAQSAWNLNNFDGADPQGPGTSAPVLDVARGNIYQIRFTWYGYGQIQFQVVDTQYGTAEAQTVITGHRVAPNGTTSIRNPNLPITAEVTGAGDGVMHLAGRQYSILGHYVPQLRTHDTTRTLTGVTTAWTPVVAMRRKNTDDAKRIKVRVSGLSAIVSADMQVGLVVNPTITFGTAVVPDLGLATSSALEFSVDPSAFTLGAGAVILTELIDSTGSGAGAGGSERFPGLSIDIPRMQPVVLVARALTSTATITALLRAVEEW